MSEFTPGTWYVAEQRRIRSSQSCDGVEAFNRTVADAFGPNDPEMEANARLIAAAPELLAACECQQALADWYDHLIGDDEARTIFKGHGFEAEWTWPCQREFISTIREAAIAKARPTAPATKQ